MSCPVRRRRPTDAAPIPGARTRARERGQSLVEFTVVLTPLLLLLLGILQLGLVFNAYITLSNATREAARAASVYLYDRTLSKAQNDALRLDLMRDTLTESLGLLRRTGPQLVPEDQTIGYALPDGVGDLDTRVGQYATVHGHYHLDLIVPMVADLLPLEDGRLALDAEVTVVVN